jgi:hypothetical protein
MELTDNNCLICNERMNRSNRLKIKCEYCDFEACRVCCETYLLTQTTPHCMNVECGKIWTRKFMSRIFTNEFMTKKYNLHREKILFEQEQALMPQTQILIERHLYKNKMLKQTKDEIDLILRMIRELTEKKYAIENYRQRLKNDQFEIDDFNGMNNINSQNIKEKESRQRTFLYRCSNESCRGFLSSRWKCNLCETWTCPECHVNIGTHDNKEHICNKEDVETVKLIRNDSKPCPKCGVIIFKIIGCDQMFCTQCHTPFSWKTGEIQVGRNIHNPHYFEYIRNNNHINERNPLDVRCGRELNMRFMRNFRFKLSYIINTDNLDDKDKIIKYILDSCRNVLHLSDIIIPNLNAQIDDHGLYNQNQRIKYIQNIITDKQFKKNIQMNEKKRQKNLELIDLFVMVRDVTVDIFLKYNDGITQLENEYVGYEVHADVMINEIPPSIGSYIRINAHSKKLSHEYLIQELSDIRNYANNCLSEIQKTYKGVKKEFNKIFSLISINTNNKCKPNVSINSENDSDGDN